MMRRIRKVLSMLAVMAMVALPPATAYASSVTFSEFSFTTTPNAEYWKVVTSRVKPDSEQNWYVTLTSKSGLSASNCRAMVLSNDSTSDIGSYVPYPLYSTTTSSGAIAYRKTVYSNKRYYLYISGNENNSSQYTIKISGRYTS